MRGGTPRGAALVINDGTSCADNHARPKTAAITGSLVSRLQVLYGTPGVLCCPPRCTPAGVVFWTCSCTSQPGESTRCRHRATAGATSHPSWQLQYSRQ